MGRERERDYIHIICTLGSCTGLPWTSMQRFPVIPPFNIPDLAGWTDNRQKMDPVFFGEAFHPISRHFNNATVPRSFYYAGLNQRFIYLSAPDISTDYITIPVSGVTALVRLHDVSQYSPWSEREILTFLKVVISPKPKKPHPPKLVYMHVTSIPTCINFLSQF